MCEDATLLKNHIFSCLMNYPLFLARRLSLSPEGEKSSPAVRVAIVAVALSVAVMMASIAVVSGFKNEITARVAGFNSHITLSVSPLSDEEDNILTLTPSLRGVLDSVPYVTGYALQAAMPGILKTKDDFKGVYVKGIDPGDVGSFVASNLEEGDMPDFSKESQRQKMVISRIAANQLGLKTGDRIDTYFIADDVRVRRMEVAGIFNSHFDTYDNLYVYAGLPLVQNLGHLSPGQGISLSVTTDDFSRVEEYAADLQQRLVAALSDGTLYRYYRVDNARNQGAGYFHWLDMLDMNVAVVLVLMTFVACMTLISGLLILILDKKRFVGLMKSLGMPDTSLRRVFVCLGMKVGCIGLIAGNVLMTALLYLQDKTHFIHLDPDSYYIDFVPVDISWVDIMLLNVAVMIVIYLALMVPARSVARISPAEAMRYE